MTRRPHQKSDSKALKIKDFHLFKLQVNSVRALTYTALFLYITNNVIGQCCRGCICYIEHFNIQVTQCS